MNEVAFEVLDELYFVTPYHALLEAVAMDEEVLRDTLIDLASKGWIVIYSSMDEEAEEYNLEDNWRSYFYLASKQGLFAHNRL